jgi:hypothetical protein
VAQSDRDGIADLPERINKLQPDRTLALRGFNSFAAAASIHSASPTGFQVSGTFRDQADFAVAVLYDADNYYEHPSIKYLPDFDFDGLTLSFSLNYSDGVQPIDSPKFPWIDWGTLDCILADGSTRNINLFSNSMLAGTEFPAASATFTVTTAGTIQPFDRITVWFQNIPFDYIVPGTYPVSALFQFFAGTTGAVHSITVNGTQYSYTEVGGDSSANVATQLMNAIDTAPDPWVVASIGSSSNVVSLAVRPGQEGNNIVLSASDGNGGATIFGYSPTMVATQLAADINVTDWSAQNTTHALLATSNGAQVTVAAAQYGTVNATATAVTSAGGTLFSGIAPGSPITIGGTVFTVATVQSPTALTLQAPVAGTLTGAAYVAARGGRDGNMIQLYALVKSPATLTLDQTTIRLSGGSSTVTWNCTLDFTALGIGQLRQCWLTFAPSLAYGAPYSATNWLATFSNWQLSGPPATAMLQVAGPGSVRLEEDDTACTYTGTWGPADTNFYSKYFAVKSNDPNGAVTVTYTCQFAHSLYLGTSLYTDRAIVGVELDGAMLTPLSCILNTGAAVVTRRLVQAGVPAGKHTVTFTNQNAGWFYFDFLEAAVLSDVPDNLTPRTNISPALDFDTDHSYKLPPARLMWIMDKLGYAGPMNEYLGVFWWNQRRSTGAVISTAQLAFTGTFVSGDLITLTVNATALQKNVYPTDTLATIGDHFAAFINETFVGAWASADNAGNLNISGRSPASAYNLTLTLTTALVAGSTGVATVTQPPQPGVYADNNWIVDDTASAPVNQATSDWHADFYAQCASRGREVVTSCSMELVNPPSGYAAMFPDGTPVATATDFGDLISTQCAPMSSKLLAYQKTVYRAIAGMQAAAGLTPCVQYGEFLWWYFSNSGGGMGYYDAETSAAAQVSLGRALNVFETPDDDPGVNGGADALFLRNRLRDHVAALVVDIRSAYPAVICEVLWPYDVNYPTVLTEPGGGTLGGQLNRYVNLPVEWQRQPTSGLDRMKAEALAFSTGLRSLDLAREAINLFPSFGWPVTAVRYLVPVFGYGIPWNRELALVWAAGLKVANLWAFDHVCLFNLDVPEPALERRSIVKTV